MLDQLFLWPHRRLHDSHDSILFIYHAVGLSIPLHGRVAVWKADADLMRSRRSHFPGHHCGRLPPQIFLPFIRHSTSDGSSCLHRKSPLAHRVRMQDRPPAANFGRILVNFPLTLSSLALHTHCSSVKVWLGSSLGQPQVIQLTFRLPTLGNLGTLVTSQEL